ncbi:MAG: deoxyribose-phosphate aldolase [Kiritimatiellae bacterium]|nr:deoxyribose-phosphate aldolase [Kiritimatiellia bacterium]
MSYKPITEAGKKIAPYIDHTVLKPDTTTDTVVRLCEEAIEYGFASVCVNPNMLPIVVEKLAGSKVLPCVVVGFPLGTETSDVKAYETAKAVEAGAEEVDMVLDICAAKEDRFKDVEKDVAAVVAAAEGKLVKVILETCFLTDEEKVKACVAVKNAGADYVKTSTGFMGGGATVEDVALMRKTVGENFGVKASGGIRNRDAALAMLEAGASRIGVSASIAIVTEN